MKGLLLSMRRIYALVYRYIALLFHSPPRLIEAIYWPIINTMLMGFMNYYLFKERGLSAVNFNVILGATLLLEFVLRSTFSFMLVFIEEIYSRNLGQLYTSPLRGHEQLIAYTIIMVFRVLALIPAIILCNVVFGYNVLELGVWFLPFTLNMLLFGITGGLFIMTLLIRFGQSAEWFGWMLSWAFIPFMGVYYPVSILPEPLRWIGMALPVTPIFESMRHLASGGAVDPAQIMQAFILNGVYLAGAVALFFATLHGARKRGNLLNLNE
jgi:ABC-2 type transport system permease protein